MSSDWVEGGGWVLRVSGKEPSALDLFLSLKSVSNLEIEYEEERDLT